MKRHIRRILKGLLWTIIALTLFVVAQVSVLAFPSPWFEHSEQTHNVTFFSNIHQGQELESLASGVQRRVQATDLYADDIGLRVYICDDQRLYNLFARLALVPIQVPGFNLSILNSSFVSVPALERRRATRDHRIEHSALAGNLEESIAHELVHDYVQESIGYSAARMVPRWKMEGYVEFQTNKAPLSLDNAATLADRIETMTSGLNHRKARDYYEWNLIVEYLSVERDYSLEQILDDSMTLEVGRQQMMSWHGASE